MLPQEILIPIFEHSYDLVRRPSSHESGTATLLSIILVCKEWRVLAEPLLYRQIMLDYKPDRKQHVASKSLRNTLKEHPTRNSYIHDLEVSYSQAHDDHGDVRTEFLSNLRQFSALRNVQLSTGGGKPTPSNAEIISQISSMATIETLFLWGSWNLTVLDHIVVMDHEVGFGALKNLIIPSLRPTKVYSLQDHKKRTSKLDVLECLGDCNLEALQELLKWPKSLKHFMISCPFDYETGRLLQQSLNLQSDSLEKISVHGYVCYPYEKRPLPQLAQFPSLTWAKFHQYNVFATPPESAVQSLSCDRLTTLVIDMDGEGQHDLCYDNFDDNHADWVLDFATRYRKVKPFGPLTRIEVLYDVFSEDEDAGSDPDYVWPTSDSLTALKPRMMDLGIDLELIYELSE